MATRPWAGCATWGEALPFNKIDEKPPRKRPGRGPAPVPWNSAPEPACSGRCQLEPNRRISHRQCTSKRRHTDGVFVASPRRCSPNHPNRKPTRLRRLVVATRPAPKEDGELGSQGRGGMGDKGGWGVGSEQDKEPNNATSSRKTKDSKAKRLKRCQSPDSSCPSHPRTPPLVSVEYFVTTPRSPPPK